MSTRTPLPRAYETASSISLLRSRLVTSLSFATIEAPLLTRLLFRHSIATEHRRKSGRLHRRARVFPVTKNFLSITLPPGNSPERQRKGGESQCGLRKSSRSARACVSQSTARPRACRGPISARLPRGGGRPILAFVRRAALGGESYPMTCEVSYGGSISQDRGLPHGCPWHQPARGARTARVDAGTGRTAKRGPRHGDQPDRDGQTRSASLDAETARQGGRGEAGATP